MAFFDTFPGETALPGRVNGLLFALGAGLFLLLAVYPLAAWPYSPVSETLHWDAGAYHFPKAVELFKTGTVWDLTIPYGEFPFGYESLLAFTLLLSGKETFFGSVHALIAILALVGTWLLARRYTRLPGGLLLFIISLVFLSELYLVKGNPFYILLDQVYMIGKNDLFLAVGVLAALVHAPVGGEGDSLMPTRRICRGWCTPHCWCWPPNRPACLWSRRCGCRCCGIGGKPGALQIASRDASWPFRRS